MSLQAQKQVVRRYQHDLNQVLSTTASTADGLHEVLTQHTTDTFHWRGMHPFYEQTTAASVVNEFWWPLSQAFSALQRREDIFLAGLNDVDDGASQWVCSMGHFVGLFDNPWLGIPPTHKMAFLRYAEFCRIEDGAISESAFFCDIIDVMHQAGWSPLPAQTGASIVCPGPATHDGLLFDPQAAETGTATMALVNRMVADLSALNLSGDDRCPPEVLERSWHNDMVWYGPAGIGTTYTIRRYQHQHQYPFREGLKDKVFNGHVARFAEGNYACFFGWANLTNKANGGFLGLTANETPADMRVVDVYRRDGDKLAENWVIIDLLHYLSMQGLDVLKRMQTIHSH